MKVSDYIASYLYSQGVSHVFEIVGGMTTHLIDSIHRHGKIKIVSTHHEQAAAFAADAMGRVTGVPGVAMATSGPGATNLLTGIGSCYFDSSPAVFITGQVNRNEQKGDRPIRQLGFQETDIVSMARPITKVAWQAESPEQVPKLLEDTFVRATSGRPGPVLLDIPMDVQRADIIVRDPTATILPKGTMPDVKLVEELLAALSKARRPLILAGGGIRAARATSLFRELAEQLRVPVVNSLMAVDILPFNHPLRVGMIGSYGNRWANLAIGRSDFLLVLGSRLDIRQTGAETKAFMAGRTIYHVDCDAAEINNRITDCHAVLSDLRQFFDAAIELSMPQETSQLPEWLAEIHDLRHSWPDTAELPTVTGINPNEFMHQLASTSHSACAFVVDVGQHQMWAAQSLELTSHQSFLTSGGMGAMGFALPAAIGVAYACPNQPVIVVAGDGGIQLNIQELETIAHHRLPIKMVVMNNKCQGMVRQFQESYFDKRYPSTFWGYSAPDFERIAKAFGIASSTVIDPSDVPGVLGRLWENAETPFLLQVMIDTYANAYPKIAFGLPFTEMEPQAKPLDMEGT